jgi:TonB family protein
MGSRLDPDTLLTGVVLDDALARRLAWACLVSMIANIILWQIASGMIRHRITEVIVPVEIRRIILPIKLPPPQIKKPEPPKPKPILHPEPPRLSSVPPPPRPNYTPPPVGAHQHILTAPETYRSRPSEEPPALPGGMARVGVPTAQQQPGEGDRPDVTVAATAPVAEVPRSAPEAPAPATEASLPSVPAPETPTRSDQLPSIRRRRGGVPLSGPRPAVADVALPVRVAPPPPPPRIEPPPPPKPKGPTRDAEPGNTVKPNIPDDLKSQAFKSFVRVKVEIHPDGSFTPVLRTSSGNMEIDRRVLEALKQWTWKPELQDGVPVECTKLFKFEFEVD